jgi:hypothetical protein
VKCTVLSAALALASLESLAAGAAPPLEEVLVEGRRTSLLGLARSASEGAVGAEDLALRPLLRPGDLLELIPGVVVTQHSGAGKSNQLFLRGFNLDHGTDFATWIDGMPVNLRTHGHGQGYTDINFLIPETLKRLTFVKGPYHAELGDFSSAGGTRMTSTRDAQPLTVTLGAGANGFQRLVAQGGQRLRPGLAAGGALEGARYDGPWRDLKEGMEKLNGEAFLAADREERSWTLRLRGYENRWRSADQIPARAVASGALNPLGSLDPALGGRTHRYSLSGDLDLTLGEGTLTAEAYLIDYRLRLWSNFTYGLDDPIRGDQFEQLDDRTLAGGALSYRWRDAGDRQHRLGLEGRFDAIDNVGLYRTAGRQRLEAFRDDAVDEGSLGAFYEISWAFAPRWRAVLGLRGDAYRFSVNAASAENSGTRQDAILSPKFNLSYSFRDDLEGYVSLGRGFHSNDARGTTLRRDPQSGEAANPVDPLVPSTGGELGLKFTSAKGLNSSLALWALHLDSELLFVGDAGNTEATRGSERWGLEFNNFWQPAERWRLEADVSWTHARFEDDAPEGNHIPGAVPLVASGSLTFGGALGPFSTVRLRHLSAYPLREDNGEKSDGSTLVNLALGWRWPRLALQLDALNLLDSQDHDIDYFYASRLPGEGLAGAEDLHFKIFEPRQLRATVRLKL